MDFNYTLVFILDSDMCISYSSKTGVGNLPLCLLSKHWIQWSKAKYVVDNRILLNLVRDFCSGKKDGINKEEYKNNNYWAKNAKLKLCQLYYDQLVLNKKPYSGIERNCIDVTTQMNTFWSALCPWHESHAGFDIIMDSLLSH